MSAIVKNLLSLAGLAFALLSNAYAGDRLFPTDILSEGEVDIRFSVARDTRSEDFTFNGSSGRSSMSQTSENIQVRYGLGSQWHIGMTVLHDSHRVANSDFNNSPTHYSNRNGKGEQNPLIWASYGIINDNASPLSLSAQIVIRPDTTGDAKTSYTGRLTAGWTSSDALKYYGQLAASFRDDLGFDGYIVGAGAYRRLSDVLTLVPEAYFSRSERTDVMSLWDQYGIGLSAQFRFAKNSYLIPALGFYINGERNSNDRLYHANESRSGKVFRLGIHHQF